MIEASLYVHIPFCLESKCDYCDFYSVPIKSDDSRIEAYIDTLLLEGKKLFEEYKPLYIPTVYIGGGTPSILNSKRISRLLTGLNETIARYSSSPPIEITVEANPESLDETFLETIAKHGVNRLSLGVQTFHQPSRDAVSRKGQIKNILKNLKLAGEYFPGNISADLISGLPLQTPETLLEDIATLMSFKPAHVSLYSLTLDKALKIPVPLNPDELWIIGRDALKKAGLKQYEVSNFCLPGKECLHNIRYWQSETWLGLGPGASGTVIGEGRSFRYTFPNDFESWNDPINEELDSLTLIKDILLMGFRYIEGPKPTLDINRLIPKTIDAWREKGLIRKNKNALTEEGLLFLNTFLVEAFIELEKSYSV